MPQIELSRLERVQLREAWENEASAFTPWLAEEENIRLLSDAIGIDLEVEAQEKSVGPFSADILCKDRATSSWVLIENQLEKTDHTHLGQLLTYAAGLKAVTIVWIASKIRDEHRAALDWLNEITNGEFNFFGLEVELWRIGDSPAAPKFNVVCQPNDWTSTFSGTTGTGPVELTTAKELQLQFWTAFREYALDHSKVIKPIRPMPQTWMPMSIGRTGFSLTAIASTWSEDSSGTCPHELRAEFVMLNDPRKIQFRQLLAMKPQIETELGHPIEWAESLEYKQSKVYVRRAVNLNDRNNWPEYCNWLVRNLEDFWRVFSQRVKQLDVSEPVFQSE